MLEAMRIQFTPLDSHIKEGELRRLNADSSPSFTRTAQRIKYLRCFAHFLQLQFLDCHLSHLEFLNLA